MRVISLAVLTLLLTMSQPSVAQVTNVFPPSGQAGIGTQGTIGGINGPFQIHHDLNIGSPTLPAIVRLSEGTSTTTDTFALFGLGYNPGFSSLSTHEDAIVHENKLGDLILTNFWPKGALAYQAGGYIRFATAGDTTLRPADASLWKTDYQRMVIAPNGNIGIDIPRDSVPRAQFQLGGGVVPYGTNPCATPGLTMFGGYDWENRPLAGGGTGSGDYRYLAFNWYTDPISGVGHRFQRCGSSGLWFSEANGGMLNISASPYDSTHGDSLRHSIELDFTGNWGLSCVIDMGDSDKYHQLFNVLPPGIKPWRRSPETRMGFSCTTRRCSSRATPPRRRAWTFKTCRCIRTGAMDRRGTLSSTVRRCSKRPG